MLTTSNRLGLGILALENSLKFRHFKEFKPIKMRNLEGDLKFFFLITQAILKCWQTRKQFKNHFKKLLF